jgi:cell division protease FtsH
MVMRLPERDSYSYHRDKMYANLSVAMGGRVAEEVIFGYDKVSSGASSTSNIRPVWRATW